MLAQAAQRGEKRAFVEIVARHQGLVCGVALGVLGDFTGSEDAAQEAFLTAWRKIHELREPEKLRPWLVQIARHAALGHLRRLKGRRVQSWEETTPSGEATGAPSPDLLAVSGEEAALVREALATLPENYRVPLVLFYRQERSVREVAAALELSEDAVKQRLERGRELLRERLSGVVESVLCRTQPGAVFTMSIAASMGALMAPAALAGGAFAAAAATPALTGTTLSSASPAATATVMSTAKFSAAAALVAAACLPLGYAVHAGFDDLSTTPVSTPSPLTTSLRAPDFSGSELYAEWVRLHEEHGHDAAAMPVLFKAIADLKNPFRRRAFRAALVAEWAQVDPASGLAFLLASSGNFDAGKQLFLEWLKHDPQAAVAALREQGESGLKLAGEADILKEIARCAPELVPVLAAELPKNRNHRSRSVAEAFAILAEKDLFAARGAAEALSGFHREDALSGVAKAWARHDMEGVITWSKALPENIDREAVLRSALVGLVSVDPAVALDKLDLVQPRGQSGHPEDTTIARILQAVDSENFNKVADWLRQHPGRIDDGETAVLSRVIAQKLDQDPAAFLDEQLERGTLGALNIALLNTFFKDGKQHLAAVWDWTQSRLSHEGANRLRETVASCVGHLNQELALAIARELPDTEEGDELRGRLSSSLLNGGGRLDRLDSYLEQASGRMRERLLIDSFQALGIAPEINPTQWQSRLYDVPEKSRSEAAGSLAKKWAQQDAPAAASWAVQLPGNGVRLSSVRAVAAVWAQSDSLAASEWIAQLPVGEERDAGAQALVMEIADDSPVEAWQWAASITESALRHSSLQKVLESISSANPLAATQWIDNSELSPAEKQALHQSLSNEGGEE